ncbi:oxygen-independent coproporphyrinogen III oxidase [Motiliproteus sp. MSK22-1]|uniref:oxygen-independent coproporphyrinogen III oxidase n=1 Tax=Motiliproteus sp. MSK22-1 TaxID=1897630 RepID=UPI0009784413|nr:oxygen-independent coproporphyrinogen III oxidase [Motiliproteus sp. MSK22-1]OMH38754.1 oxygen-independent coproporphyrinogen III oxidase [Motiliproteus sp. MSK22-1]
MTAENQIKWDLDLIKRYDLSGPRYTSYPTAIQFDPELSPRQLVQHGQETADKTAPLSLYMHIPFCTHVCYFCACNKVITRNKKRAQPYLEQLYIEMRKLSEWYSNDRIVNQLHWGGGTPSFINDDQMRELVGHIRSNFNLRDDDLGDYSIEIDPREADAGRMKVIRELGFNRVSLGVQDIKTEVQQAVNRVQPIALSEEIITSSRDLGFKSINIDLIYGLPHQTIDSFSATLEKIIELSPDRLSIFNYAHMPDRFRSQKHINAEDLPAPEDKLVILENTISQLISAGYVYIGMDHFAKPTDELAIAQQEGNLHRNFQGYTTHSDCDLVAMGVSAISQIGDVYYQNEHDLKLYQDAIDSSEQAIKRGVILSKDDRIRRAVITKLICHFELDCQQIEASFGIEFNDYFKDELLRMDQYIKDGLLVIDGPQIIVTPAGRLLIRRICMTFDAYIPKEQTGRTFSRII